MTSTERIKAARVEWLMANRTGWIDDIKDYARAHYADGKGWDYVVECWGDREIAEAIGNAKTPKGALWSVARVVKAMADHEAEIKSTAF